MPKYCKPVGAALDQLEKSEVIEKVTQSYWATPTVVVRKPGGRVRICDDLINLESSTENDVLMFTLYRYHKNVFTIEWWCLLFFQVRLG